MNAPRLKAHFSGCILRCFSLLLKAVFRCCSRRNPGYPPAGGPAAVRRRPAPLKPGAGGIHASGRIEEAFLFMPWVAGAIIEHFIWKALSTQPLASLKSSFDIWLYTEYYIHIYNADTAGERGNNYVYHPKIHHLRSNLVSSQPFHLRRDGGNVHPERHLLW